MCEAHGISRFKKGETGLNDGYQVVLVEVIHGLGVRIAMLDWIVCLWG